MLCSKLEQGQIIEMITFIENVFKMAENAIEKQHVRDVNIPMTNFVNHLHNTFHLIFSTTSSFGTKRP